MPNSDASLHGRDFLPAKVPARLSELLGKMLNAYTLSAGAAGVAALACALPAEGAPVCKTLSTELHHTNSFPLYLPGVTVAPVNIVQTTNSQFVTFSSENIFTAFWWNRAFFTPNSAGANVMLGAKGLPADLASGAEIGPGGDFGKGASYGMLFTYGRGRIFTVIGGGTKLKHRGNFSFAGDNYIGFEFSDLGAIHYGWARLSASVIQGAHTKARLTVLNILGYGYETTPNTAIAAGSCSTEQASNGDVQNSSPTAANPSLGMLALGSEGLASWRSSLF
jgi:hypothetical protein